MHVKIKMDKAVLRKLSAAQRKAALRTAEQMRHEIITEARMPFDEGTLQNVQTSTEVRHNGVRINHDTPYATRLYFNPQYNFDTTINANAGGLWWEDYLTGSKKKRPEKLFAHYYRKVKGGL